MVEHRRDRVGSLVLASARAGSLFAAWMAIFTLPAVLLVLVANGFAPGFALLRALGKPIAIALAMGLMFAVFWFAGMGTIWLFDRRSKLLEPGGERPSFRADETIVREGIGTLERAGRRTLGKLYLTSERLRFRPFRLASNTGEEAIPLALMAAVSVHSRRLLGVPTRCVVVDCADEGSAVFYVYDETTWREEIARAAEGPRGLSTSGAS